MTKIKLITLVLCGVAGIVGVISGCYYDKEELLYPGSVVNCNTINAHFTDVKPIIQAKCATTGCHNAASAAGNTVLETYDQISSKAARINQRALIDRTMPPSPPLTTTDIGILKCWINSGAPNN